MDKQPSPPWSRSFELVYYDPKPDYRGRTPFRDPANDPLTTEQRLAYLGASVDLLRRLYDLSDNHLSSEVVSESEAEYLASQIKPQPLPRLRYVVPLRYWRWKLHGMEGLDWVAPGYDDSLWNELEAPAVFDMGRALLLRCTVEVAQAERIVLDVEAIHDAYDLWVNGHRVGHHEGYEPHTVELTSFLQPDQPNTVAIKVAEQPGYQIGLAGAIRLIGTRATWVEDLFVKPVAAAEGHPARVQIRATVGHAGTQPFSGQLAVRFSRWFPEEDATVAVEVPPLAVAVPPGQTAELVQECLLPEVELWWPERPRLYKVEAVLTASAGEPLDDVVETTGIRTIQQRGGRLYLNGRRFVLRSFGNHLGFAPATDSHGAVCPPDPWIVRDLMLAKRANANALRLHPWGFSGQPGVYNDYGWPEWGLPTDGTNYVRIAELADQIGLCLIWVTRHWTLWGHGFREHYRDEEMERLLGPSLRRVRNRPSIIAYEGLNEVGSSLLARVVIGRAESPVPWTRHLQPQEIETLTRLHQQRYLAFCARYIRFVNAVDDSRLVCPDSMWGPSYQRNPQRPTMVQHEDEAVFTLADNVYWDPHDYIGWYTEFKDMYAYQERFWPADRARPVILTECGAEAMPDWQRYRGLPWCSIWLNNGRSCAAIEQARLGRPLRVLRDSEAHLSQAYQGLCIQQTAAFVRTSGCDGMNVNLLADGLSGGNYHKGMCDLYRRAKLGYFAARMAYQPTLVTGMDGDFVLAEGDALHLVLVNDAPERVGRRVQVQVRVVGLAGHLIDATEVEASIDESGMLPLGDFRPRFVEPGLYQIEYVVVPR